MKLFVYGTLKRGFCNHGLIDGKYLGLARLENYALLGFQLPLITPSNGHFVIGELYEIEDENCWLALDALENHPHTYKKTEVEFEDPKCKALVYIPNPILVKIVTDHLRELHFKEYGNYPTLNGIQWYGL